MLDVWKSFLFKEKVDVHGKHTVATKPARRHAATLHLSDCTKNSSRDWDNRVAACENIIKIYLKRQFFSVSDQAHIHLPVCINKKNFQYRSTDTEKFSLLSYGEIGIRIYFFEEEYLSAVVVNSESCAFFMWGYHKAQVCKHRPRNTR